MVIITSSEKETKKLAAKLAKQYFEGGIFALSGPLGSGKTTFVQGFAQSLGITEKIISPTFILMRFYNIPNKKEGKLYHLDLYRLNRSENIKELGLEEIFANNKNIILIEWAEKLDSLLPKKITQIILQILPKNQRKIFIKEKKS